VNLRGTDLTMVMFEYENIVLIKGNAVATVWKNQHFHQEFNNHIYVPRKQVVRTLVSSVIDEYNISSYVSNMRNVGSNPSVGCAKYSSYSSGACNCIDGITFLDT
jgi:hypothetical protein